MTLDHQRSRAHQLISFTLKLVCFTLMALNLLSCAEPFRVASRPTANFPQTWEQRLLLIQQE